MANQSSNIKIALLVILGFLIAIFGLSFLKGAQLFGQDPVYYSVFDSASGLTKAHKVVLNGVDIGKVEDVELIEGYQKVKVTYSIDDKIKVPNDSEVRINGGIPGFGSPQLVLQAGLQSSFFDKGAQIPIYEQSSLTSKIDGIVDEIGPTTKSLNSAMKRMDSVTLSLNKILSDQNIKNIESSLSQLNSTMTSLNTTGQTVDQMVMTQKVKIDEIFSNLQAISSNLKDNQAFIDNALSNFSKTSDELASLELKATIDQTQETIGELNSILEKINTGDGSLSLLINDANLYNNLNNAARNLDRLILEIKENPSEVVPPISVFPRKKKK